MSASAWRAHVDHEKCVACGKCVEVCPAGAAKLGQKLCRKDGSKTLYPMHLLPDDTPWGEGSIGYKGFNMYRFKVSDMKAIQACLQERADHYQHSYNAQVLAQEIITDLLDEGLLTYGGYDFKKQQKDHHSI